MTKSSETIVRRARALVGTRFRPQGRDPVMGLDCVGLIVSAFTLPGDGIRRDYRLRGPHGGELKAELRRHFRRISAGAMRGGDVMLCAVAADPMHLAIECGGSFVHADARLRKIVETPGNPGWPIVAVFRRRTPKRRSG